MAPWSFFSPRCALAQATPLHGIDVTDLDRKVDPCTDFFEFANGTWRASHPYSGDPGALEALAVRRNQQRPTERDPRRIADRQEQGQGSTEQIVGDYYGACMNESRVNARGMDALKPWFSKINASSDTAGLQAVQSCMTSWSRCRSMGGPPDPHKPSWVLADFSVSGYALPDRDYYLKPDARFKDAREKYVAHVARMLTLAGRDQQTATAAAATVMGLETKFAEAALDNVALRDPSATDHNTTFVQLQAMVTSL